MISAPQLSDIVDGASRLRGYAVTTPLLESPVLNAETGARLLIKAEMLQRTGAFKFRGAWNWISRLGDEEGRRGVVAFSSGNHGQAVAAAAAIRNFPATIVMPTDAPRIKIDSTRRHGAEIVPYDRATEDREAICAAIAAESGATVIPPYDHPLTIAGQGTIGLEIADQAGALGATPDMALVPISGGGLIAGCAIALTEKFPGIEIYGVEPEGYDDTARSLASGRRETIRDGAETICDALRVAIPGELTFAINRRLLAGAVAVSDDNTATAMRAAFDYFKLVAEPGGAIALAAALCGAVDCRGRTVAVVCSGGNVDADAFARVLSRRSSDPR